MIISFDNKVAFTGQFRGIQNLFRLRLRKLAPRRYFKTNSTLINQHKIIYFEVFHS